MTKSNLTCKPARPDFDGISISQIEEVLRTGDLGVLTASERQYLSLMEMVRGLRARMLLPGGRRLVTKAGIVKLLKSEAYGLSDWMARRVYADAINFFYAVDDVRPRAWANLYAERLEKYADLAVATGRLREARSMLVEAARLRGCYKEQEAEIPAELLNAAPTVVYTADAADVGAPSADRRELEAFIDAIPDVPSLTRARVKQDAGIAARNLLERLASDRRDFGQNDDNHDKPDA